MKERVSIEGFVLELQKLMHDKHDAGISAALDSAPRAAIQGTDITVHARIFASASVLAGLTPVLRCNDIADFADRFLAGGEPGPDCRDYAVTLRSWNMKADKAYHLALHPSPAADAIAQCTVHVFRKGIVAAVRRWILRWRLRNIILRHTSERAAPSRQHRP
jgi:hypothetical protein